MYSVKEIFYTLQGEGVNAGRAAVFLRFAGCNLWSGKEQTRAGAVCKFCDTQFIGTDGENGGKFSRAMDLANKVWDIWENGVSLKGHCKKLVVCTGGEPLLQLDTDLIDALHDNNFEIAVETNGTVKAPEGIDWICVSPKANAELVQVSGDELKLVYPQPENKPGDFAHLDFKHFFLSPRDTSFEKDDYETNLSPLTPTQEAIRYCLANPQWRLSLQTHKIVGLK